MSGTPSEAVTLYGGSAERFREVRESLEDRRGREHSNADTVRAMMDVLAEEADL